MVRAWRDATTENYRGYLKRRAKVAQGEPDRSAKFVVRIYLLRLAKEVTTDSSLKGTIAGVRAPRPLIQGVTRSPECYAHRL